MDIYCTRMVNFPYLVALKSSRCMEPAKNNAKPLWYPPASSKIAWQTVPPVADPVASKCQFRDTSTAMFDGVLAPNSILTKFPVHLHLHHHHHHHHHVSFVVATSHHSNLSGQSKTNVLQSGRPVGIFHWEKNPHHNQLKSLLPSPIKMT